MNEPAPNWDAALTAWAAYCEALRDSMARLRVAITETLVPGFTAMAAQLAELQANHPELFEQPEPPAEPRSRALWCKRRPGR